MGFEPVSDCQMTVPGPWVGPSLTCAILVSPYIPVVFHALIWRDTIWFGSVPGRANADETLSMIPGYKPMTAVVGAITSCSLEEPAGP